MKKPQVKKMAGAVAALGIMTAGTTAPASRIFHFPERLEVSQGQDVLVNWSRFLPVAIRNGTSQPVMVRGASGLDFQAPQAGHYLLHFRLFGWLPWRGVPVDVTKPVYVVPGGESLGVVVRTRGLVVTHFAPVRVANRIVDPAAEAGVERGDVIAQVDGLPAVGVGVLEQRVNVDGTRHRPVSLRILGARSERVRLVQPVWSSATHQFHIGLDVQDRTSGVGTLSFYNPASDQYAALGHSMTDGLTRRPVGVMAGRAIGADIVGLVPATDTQPGQKVGVLAGPTNISGTVADNGILGIVGHLDHPPVWGPQKEVPIALPDQVHPGPATIITVLHGQSPEMFHIEILKAVQQYAPNVKGLLFRVTDPSLLAKTGGIVQGMSGSPILQNGRLVGAVTHVLVNRPTLGFGCYAYWMERQPSFRMVGAHID